MRALLEARHGWRVVDEAANGREAVAKARELLPDVATLDIKMPEMDGLSAARGIRETTRRKVEVLMVSNADSPAVVVQALGVGARGFLSKVDIGSELIPAIHTVAQHKIFLSQTVLQSLTDRIPVSDHFSQNSGKEGK
jgi:DNA-binding NarL/FixJ family response regulator